MHNQQIEEARNMAPYLSHTITAKNTSPWLVIQYVPDLGTGGTSASIAHDNTSLTFLVDSAAPTGLDAIGTDGVITLSGTTWDTLGELVDYINGTSAWRAYLVGALRADKCSLLANKSATACTKSGTNHGLTFYSTTSTSLEVSLAISGEWFESYGIGGWHKEADEYVENILGYANVQLTFTGVTNTIKVYTESQTATGTTIYSAALSSTTAKELGATGSIEEPFIRGPIGQRLIVRAAVGTAVSAYTNFHVVGKSAVWKQNRIHAEKNYTAG